MLVSHSNIVEFIGDIFHRRGAESYLGEQVTMSEHMLQAARLAELEDGRSAMIAAALLHDIGHYTNEFPEDALAQGINNHHDVAGAEVLNPFFPQQICDCVRYHVDAKRYLCRVDRDYFSRLSPASVHTLELQGGPMNDDEVTAFESLQHCLEIVQVRKWDERAKVAKLHTPDFEYYAQTLRELVVRECDEE